MAFKCLTHTHIIFVGLILSWKEDKGDTLTCSGSSYWGAVSSGAFGIHQRVTLTSCFHSTCLFAEGPYEKGEARRWGRDPKFPVQATKNVVVWVQVGKEFPNMRQNERRIVY